MTRMTSMGGMLPEQVWDAAPIAARLRAGRYIDLTFRSGANWIGTDFRIRVTARSQQPG